MPFLSEVEASDKSALEAVLDVANPEIKRLEAEAEEVVLSFSFSFTHSFDFVNTLLVNGLTSLQLADDTSEEAAERITEVYERLEELESHNAPIRYLFSLRLSFPIALT